MIYLDNAATTSPKPKIVRDASAKALENLVVNPGRSGHAVAEKAAEEIYACRKKAASFFGSENPENVVFTLNCTHALNFVIKGVLVRGDHVIVSSMEHNAVMRPINKLKKEGIIEYDAAEVILGNEDATVRSFERLIKNNTKMIICTHASNVFGVINPIKKIGELCKRYNLIFAVDAAQTAGILPIDIKDCRIDYLCCAGHKGLYGPMGTGILLSGGKKLKTLIEGGTGNFSNELDQPSDLPERLESGTMNTSGIIALSKGFDFVNSKGIDNIYRHELKYTGLAYDMLVRNRNVVLYCPRPEYGAFVPVLSFNVKGRQSMEVAEYLSKNDIAVRAGYHCAPMAHRMFGTDTQGTVRISPSVFTVENDIKSLVIAVNKFTSVKKSY